MKLNNNSQIKKEQHLKKEEKDETDQQQTTLSENVYEMKPNNRQPQWLGQIKSQSTNHWPTSGFEFIKWNIFTNYTNEKKPKKLYNEETVKEPKKKKERKLYLNQKTSFNTHTHTHRRIKYPVCLYQKNNKNYEEGKKFVDDDQPLTNNASRIRIKRIRNKVD